MDKNLSKSSLARANQDRDYHIFEEHAYCLVNQVKQKCELALLTNNAMHISALQVAELYKSRWQVELFFKWLEQHLKIKKFRRITANAVRIQIYIAMCALEQLDRSTYEVLQILSISLTDKIHLQDLFGRTKFLNDKEPFKLNEPNLFNFLNAPILKGH